MAKKRDKEDEFKITSEDTRKFRRALRREEALKRGTFIRTGSHKTSKKDEEERESGVLSPQELAQLLAEEQEELENDQE